MGGRSNRDKGRERESGQKEHKIAGEIKTDRRRDGGRRLIREIQKDADMGGEMVAAVVRGAPRPPLTCLGAASGTARLGDSVLPKLRQDES